MRDNLFQCLQNLEDIYLYPYIKCEKENCAISGTEIENKRIENLKFENCNVLVDILSGLSIVNTLFDMCLFGTGVNFEDIVFYKCDFINCDFYQMSFSRCVFIECIFLDCIKIEEVRVSECTYHRVAKYWLDEEKQTPVSLSKRLIWQAKKRANKREN